MNWNILLASGIEIKRDSMISVNESRRAFKYDELSFEQIQRLLVYIDNK